MKVMRVKKSFRTTVKGAARRGFNQGELVPESHPLVRQFPNYFERVEDHVANVFPEHVESASAEPGSKRRRGRPKSDNSKQEPSASLTYSEANTEESTGDEA